MRLAFSMFSDYHIAQISCHGQSERALGSAHSHRLEPPATGGPLDGHPATSEDSEEAYTAMESSVEIRWHGRGGQGAKTAALLLGESAIHDDKYVQAFPEYGPERMGAPVQSFNRISDEPIVLHCSVTNPRVVVVLDASLMEAVDITAGLDEDGVLLINTPETPEAIRARLNWRGRKLFTVDASRIAQETIRRNVPNTPMMGALVKATGILQLESMLEDTRHKLEKKFKNRPEIVEGNIQAIRRAYEEVQVQ